MSFLRLTAVEDHGRSSTRWVVVWLVAGCAVATGAWALVRRQLRSDRLDSVARVGEMYLRESAEPDALTDGAVTHTLGGRTGAKALDQLDDLVAEVRRDFERGDVVRVDGWLLASSEARAAALVAVDRRRRGWIGGRHRGSRQTTEDGERGYM